MDWGTFWALLVGAAITLVSTFSATVGTEFFREWRAEKRQRSDIEEKRIKALQTDIVELSFRVKALQAEKKMGSLGQMARASKQEAILADLVARTARIAVKASRLADDEAREIVEEVRVATRNLATDDKDYVRLADEFAPVAVSANRRLGELIRRRKW